ncbi:MAG: TIGR01621 family pseudouridine synthase [Chitinivorax sp.]
MCIPILQHTQHWLAVNKPAGLNFHSEDGEAGLVALLRRQLGFELYAVHRLDKLTSGIVLFGKSSDAANQLAEQLRNRQMQKFYIALSDQKPGKKQGAIIGDMVKSRNGTWRLMRSKDNPAITQFFSYGLENGLRLFLLQLHSGKTHQLRVAMKSLGSPVLGDVAYGSRAEVDRGYLHAWAVRFTFDGDCIELICPPSEGAAFTDPIVQQQLDTIGLPWALAWPKC